MGHFTDVVRLSAETKWHAVKWTQREWRERWCNMQSDCARLSRSSNLFIVVDVVLGAWAHWN